MVINNRQTAFRADSRPDITYTTAPPPTPHGAFPSPLGEAAEGWTTGARFAQSQPGRQVALGSRPPPRGSEVTLPRHAGPQHHGQGTAGGGFEAGDKA